MEIIELDIPTPPTPPPIPNASDTSVILYSQVYNPPWELIIDEELSSTKERDSEDNTIIQRVYIVFVYVSVLLALLIKFALCIRSEKHLLSEHTDETIRGVIIIVQFVHIIPGPTPHDINWVYDLSVTTTAIDIMCILLVIFWTMRGDIGLIIYTFLVTIIIYEAVDFLITQRQPTTDDNQQNGGFYSTMAYSLNAIVISLVMFGIIVAIVNILNWFKAFHTATSIIA